MLPLSLSLSRRVLLFLSLPLSSALLKLNLRYNIKNTVTTFLWPITFDKNTLTLTKKNLKLKLALDTFICHEANRSEERRVGKEC